MRDVICLLNHLAVFLILIGVGVYAESHGHPLLATWCFGLVVVGCVLWFLLSPAPS